ncbi:hypothetical protein DRP53_09605, partial [candidate division WOR-3 bacterium]
SWEMIKRKAMDAEIIVVTHYHRDHHNPEEPEIYQDKEVYLKDCESNINYHQKLRAVDLIRKISPIAKKIESAEGKILRIGKTRIIFSPPLPHGRTEKLGFVVALAVIADETFLFTSDVQGLVRPEHLDFVMGMAPQLVYLDGPNTSMLGYRFFPEDLKASLQNITALLNSDFLNRLIIDHHLLRDPNWQKWLAEIPDKFETAASFMGKEERLLEAHRRELYQRHPVENVEKSGKNVER